MPEPIVAIPSIIVALLAVLFERWVERRHRAAEDARYDAMERARERGEL